MSKSSGGTRIVSSANAAASRTVNMAAVSTQSGGASKPEIKLSQKDNKATYKVLSSSEYYSQLEKAVSKIASPIYDKIESSNDVYSSKMKNYIDSIVGKGTFDKAVKEVAFDNYGGKNYEMMTDNLTNKVRSYYGEKMQKKLKITKKNPKGMKQVGFSTIIE